MLIHKCFGLDLGTTNSTASVIKNGEIIYAEENKSRNRTIPSIVAIRKNGEEVYGTIARNEFFSGNKYSKKSVKRDMGKNIKIKLEDKENSPEEISSKIINYCKKCLISTIGEEENVKYDNVIITVPAYFNLAQKNATKKAGELAGLNVKMLLEEPTAAAINYVVNNNVKDGLFFVVDLGGGTFDVSILEKIENIPSVLATAGNNFLGGDNFDFILARYFLDYLSKEYDLGDVVVDFNDNKFRLLMFAAENVKKRLTEEEKIDINYADIFKDNSGVELNIYDFTRDKFNELIKEKIEIDVIKECDKALEILKEKYDKDLNDITHVLLVGGSSKIPFVQQKIKERYCITESLKDVILFEPNLSISAGAAIVASVNGIQIENDDQSIFVNINSPYTIDDKIYLSGQVEKGQLKSISLKTKRNTISTEIDKDGMFILVVDKDDYMDTNEYSLYDENGNIERVVTSENASVDIIAPTPVQNETIAVEIIDVEKGKIEKYPIINVGESLPCSSKELFKLNEYSEDQIVLPIWEGLRHIFNLEINLPKTAKIGNIIEIVTYVDDISNITLEVSLEGKKLEGKYVMIKNENLENNKVEEYDDIFDERIKYVDNIEEKEKYIERHKNVKRELKEAKANNDENHFSAVSQEYQQIIADMPLSNALLEKDFDEIGEKIISKLSEKVNIKKSDVDNLVFYGKRFLKKGNIEESQKCYDDLEQMLDTVNLLSSPKYFYDMASIATTEILQLAISYTEQHNNYTSKEINKLLRENIEEVDDIFNKYSENKTESAEMERDAKILLNFARKIYVLIDDVDNIDKKSISKYKGLVSKA